MTRLLLILVILLLLCLAPLPYGYFQFIRFAAMAGFVYMGIKEETDIKYVFFGLAILFQPFIKIALGRSVWNVVDVMVAVFLLVLTFSKNNSHKV